MGLATSSLVVTLAIMVVKLTFKPMVKAIVKAKALVLRLSSYDY